MTRSVAAPDRPRPAVNVEFTDEDLHVVRAALEAYAQDFGHDEAAVTRRIREVMAKLAKTGGGEATEMGERAIGKVTHYFGKLGVAAVSLTEPLRVGDRIHVVGHTTDETVTVDRMQVDHEDVQAAGPGDDVAVHVSARVREHDEVRRADPS